jgi:hypothetical protein
VILETIARLVQGSRFFNTINVRTVELFFQKSPARPGGDVRGIDKLDFQVLADGSLIQTGQTGRDGRIQMRVRGAESTLQVLVAGAVVAEYSVRLRDDAIEAAATAAGQQRRLRMLGYHLGHGGADGNGVDGAAVPAVQTDRSILEFQADANLPMSSLADAATLAALPSAARA